MSALQRYVGQTVALTSCPALKCADLADVTISGLFDVTNVEWQDYSAGIRETTLALARTGTDPADWFTVLDMDFVRQVDPRAWAAMLRSEREMDFAAEQAEAVAS